ncbi:hypothetical protein DPEC_G00095620 [Dallia pectoralis]|uniref:Uncharacterized protein n=1 Tax=Dallia pectoralis TaxID=75939 RepID=A0ACC2GVA9_DALPE|nr:hypothetical protein DPEC_G00095620 [Dallia pectoralis]
MITPAVEKENTGIRGPRRRGEQQRRPGPRTTRKQRGVSDIDEPDFSSEKGKYQNCQRIAGARASPAELTQPPCGDRDETPHQACSYPKETLRRGDVTP